MAAAMMHQSCQHFNITGNMVPSWMNEEVTTGVSINYILYYNYIHK